MEESEREYGIVYVLTNKYMPGLAKIGMTKRDEIDTRLNELYTTGVPTEFKPEYSCKVPLELAAELEAALHTAFAPPYHGR